MPQYEAILHAHRLNLQALQHGMCPLCMRKKHRWPEKNGLDGVELVLFYQLASPELGA